MYTVYVALFFIAKFTERTKPLDDEIIRTLQATLDWYKTGKELVVRHGKSPEAARGTWAANRRAGRVRRAPPRARREGSSGRRREPCALQPWQPSPSTSQRGVLLRSPCAAKSLAEPKSPSRQARREAALRCGGGGGGAAVSAVVVGMIRSGSGRAGIARKMGRPIGLRWILGRAFHFHVSVSVEVLPLQADTWFASR
jgi:hypothetical protein